MKERFAIKIGRSEQFFARIIRAMCVSASLFAITMGIVWLPTPAFSQTDSSIDWLTGKELKEALRLPVSGDFKSAPIRNRLSEFAKRQRTGVFVDRRVDPNIELEMSFSDLTIEQFLQQLTDDYGLGICRVGDLFYVGPKDSAKILPLLIYQLREDSLKLKRANKSGPNWTSKSTLAWPELTTPRDLIKSVCESNQVELLNDDLIPHDLWPEVSLPPLSLDHQLALLVVGFDLWLELNKSGEVKLTAFPKLESGVCSVEGVKDASRIARNLRSEFEHVKFKATGSKVRMTGSAEDLWQARRWLVKQQVPERSAQATQVYSIETTAQRGSILASLAKQIDCKLNYPPHVKNVLLQRVTINMVQQPVETIIEEVLKGTDLKFQIQGSQLSITQ